MRTYITILLFLLSPALLAQDFRVKLSDKHIRKIEKTKDARTKLRKYRKFYSKDSTKALKRLKKELARKSDSLLQVIKQEKELMALREKVENNPNLQKIRELEGVKAVEQYGDKIPLDSASRAALKKEALAQGKTLAEEKAGQIKEVQEAQVLKADGEQYLKEYQQYAQMSPDSLQTVVTQKAQQQLEQRASQLGEIGELQKRQQAVEELQNLPEQYKQEYEQYLDQEHLKSETKELAKNQAVDHFAQHADKLAQAHSSLAKLKKKYASLLNSNDLSTGIKRTSLKGRPFKERLVLGGNFQVNTLEPVSLDLSPLLGYKVNKKFVLGVGGTYRQTFGSVEDIKNLSAEVYGGKGFVRYDVVKSFFAYGEYEYMNTQAMDSTSDVRSRQWVSTLQLGVGRKFSIHPKVQGQVMVLYNFLHDPDRPVYPRPWSIRVGFSLSELAMLKR